MVHPEFLQVVYPRLLTQRALGTLLGQCQELALVQDARHRIHREVPMMHFVHHDIRKALQRRTHIVFPPLRVGGVEVEHGSTLPVHTHGLGHDARRIAQPLASYLYIKGIELPVQVLLHGYLPRSVFLFLHRNGLVGRALVSRLIEQHPYLIGHGRPERELGLYRRVIHFGELSLPNRILVESTHVFLYRLATDRSRNDTCQNQTFELHILRVLKFLLHHLSGILGYEILPAGVCLCGNRAIHLQVVTIGRGQRIRGIEERSRHVIVQLQHALQHVRHLLLACLSVARYRHLDFQRGIFRYRYVSLQGSCHSHPLRTPQLEHRLHVLPEERRLDGQLVRQVRLDDSAHPLTDVCQLQVVVGILAEVYHPQREHLRLRVHNVQHPISHQVRTRVNAQYHLVLDRLSHLMTSISVGNPTTLSLKIFSNSSFKAMPCSVCQRCKVAVSSTSHCNEKHSLSAS